MVASITPLGRKDTVASVVAVATYFTSLGTADYYTGTQSGEPAGQWYGEGAKSLGLHGKVHHQALVELLCGSRPDGSGRLLRQPPRRDESAMHQTPADQPHEPHRDQPDNASEPPRKHSANGSEQRRRPAHNASEPHPQEREPISEPDKKPRRRRDWAPGFDLTLSVMKSVSVLWAVAPPQVRQAIDRAIDSAARETLGWLERSVLLARRGTGGFREEHAKLVVAMFHHSVPRNFLEPQRHVHCVFPNVCQRPDGSWATLNSRMLMRWTRTLGPIFRCLLAEALKRQLGLELVRAQYAPDRPATWFEIKGVRQSLMARWSSRTGQIDELLQGDSRRDTDSSPEARRHAALATRDPKTALPPQEQLFRQWQQEAAEHRFGEQQARQLLGKARPVDVEQAYRQAWQQTLREMTRERAHFTTRELIQHVCEALQEHGISGTVLADRVRSDLAKSAQIIALGKYRAEEQFTTRQMWQLEEKFLADVHTLTQRPGIRLPTRSADKIIAAHRSLTKEQAAAARLLLTADGAIRALAGVAGAGKSRTLRTVREGLEAAGYRVIGGAVAGAAKEELAAKAGIPGRTVASYLYHWDGTPPVNARQPANANPQPLASRKPAAPTPDLPQLNAKTVLVIDEAGQLDTQAAARLILHVKQAGATLILAGDEQQLPPIRAGAPFRRITQEAPAARLQENIRQKRATHDRDAAHDIRSGKADKALASYAQRGRLTVAKDRQDTVRQLVAAWAQDGGLQRPQDAVIFTQTRREAGVINRLCQAHRQIAGTVSPKGLQVGDQRICQGDRVLFHAPLRRYGVENGYRATVLEVHPLRRTITVHLDQEPSPQARAKGHRQTITVPVKDLARQGLSLAYAATTHKLQGQSVPRSYVLLGAMTDKEMAYVQATRGQECTRLFVDQLHAGEELQDLARAMSKSRAKNLAHDLPRAKRQTLALELRLQQDPT